MLRDGHRFSERTKYLRKKDIFCERWHPPEKNERWTNDLDCSEKLKNFFKNDRIKTNDLKLFVRT